MLRFATQQFSLNPAKLLRMSKCSWFHCCVANLPHKTIMLELLKIIFKTVRLNCGTYAKYVSRSGGLHWKKSEVVFPYRHVSPFLRIALTMYIFPTLLSPNFKFFLKSRNLK